MAGPTLTFPTDDLAELRRIAGLWADAGVSVEYVLWDEGRED